MENENQNQTIGMLLDIEHLHGEHEGRLGPLLITLCLCAAPVLLYIYFQLFLVIPVWLACTFFVLFGVRVCMKTLGREGHRVRMYKRQLNDEYTDTTSLLNISTIHPDGCIEYRNGKIVYLVCCFNGTCEDDIQHTVQLRKLLDSLLGTYQYDTYIQNITDSPALMAYYDKVCKFDRNASARNFISIIDHNIELAEDSSLVTCTVYAIKGYRSDWKDIRNQIDLALGSRASRVYKNIYRIDNPDDANLIMNRDVDTVINVSDLLRRKYSTQQYESSKVLAYDLPDNEIILQGQQAQVKVIDESTKGAGFHTLFKEEE